MQAICLMDDEVRLLTAITPPRSLVEGGSVFDADHPSRWVIFARRFTQMTIKYIASVLFGGLFTASIAAEELSHQEQGRIAVSQCYAACTDGWYESWVEATDKAEWAVNVVASDGFRYLSRGDQVAFVKAARNLLCLETNVLVRRLDACRAGCIDIEVAYGEVPTSYIRNRFSRMYTKARDNARRLGLWDEYYRDVNVEAACERAYEQLSSEYEYRSGATFEGGDATPGDFESLLMHPMLMNLPEWEIQ